MGSPGSRTTALTGRQSCRKRDVTLLSFDQLMVALEVASAPRGRRLSCLSSSGDRRLRKIFKGGEADIQDGSITQVRILSVMIPLGATRANSVERLPPGRAQDI